MTSHAYAGGPGSDVINGTDAAFEVFNGLGGNDTIRGGGGVDYICGGDGADDLRGEAGDDSVFGGSGDDELYLGARPGGTEVGEGENGADTVFAGDDADGVHGGCRDMDPCSSDAKDIILEEQGAHAIWGDEGDDSLGGGYGTNDSLLGETGVDFLDGGPGTNDQCDSGPPPGDGDDSVGCEVGPG